MAEDLIITKRDPSKWGYIPDLMDARDLAPSFKLQNPASLPDAVDLRPRFDIIIPILNQQTIGSCVANAVSVAHMCAQRTKHKFLHVAPSRLFIYYNARDIEGSAKYDAGCMIRDAIKSVASQGVCPESIWRYKVDQFAVRPPLKCYADALKYQLLQYERLDNENLTQLLSCLAAGFPFVFGFSVYSSFDSTLVERTGIYEPNPKKERVLGGHAVICFGYNRLTETFLIRNSWGVKWGLNGYFTMRFKDMQNVNMCEDLWKISLVE